VAICTSAPAAETPGDEFQIAGIGPVSSLVFAGLFWGVDLLADAQGWSPAVAGVARYMAFLNLALAVFNLFPGLSLFGGGGLVGALWFVFIGWFLANAASASYKQVLLKEVLRDVNARDAMTPSPETVSPDLGLDRLVNEHFLKRPYNAFPVTEDGIAVGLVTLSQIKEVPRDDWPLTRVADVMSPLEDTLIVEPDSPMTHVLERMSENETKRVLVAREFELLGIITARDIAHWLERAELTEGMGE